MIIICEMKDCIYNMDNGEKEGVCRYQCGNDEITIENMDGVPQCGSYDNKKLEEEKENKRMFPIQLGEDVTWEEGEQYYYLYAERFGDSQSVERIAERGGFSHEEIELLVKERNE